MTDKFENLTSKIESNLPLCAVANIEDFPNDFFTQTQRKYGAVLFHFGFAAFLFMSIMRVCDDYFMNSLEIIAQVWAGLIRIFLKYQCFFKNLTIKET